MAKLKAIHIPDLKGGYSTNEASELEDNQLANAQNVFYDRDEVLTMRRGSAVLGQPIADLAIAINECEATTNFAVANDATTLATGAAKRGANSVSFTIDVSNDAGNDFATLTNASLGALDLTGALGYIGFWLSVPADFNTNLTDVKIRLGSDATNYHEWTLGTLTEGAYQFIVLQFSDATDTGAPDDTSVDYFRLQVTYTGAYTDKTPVLLDSIFSYSSASTKAVHSMDFYEFSNGDRYLLAGCGTGIFEYNEATQYWEVLKIGLTDGLRFDSAVYLDVIYITNGTDNYMDYDGTAVTEYAGVEKGKYITVSHDTGVLSGVDGSDSVVYYSGAVPANLQSFPNSVEVNQDDGQKITGIEPFQTQIIVTKERSTYKFNIIDLDVNNIDYDGGCRSNRCLTRVENDLFMLSDNGVFGLAQRQGVSGEYRGTALSNNIREAFDSVEDKTIACAFYWPATNNYYVAVDDSGTSQNQTIYVYSTLTRGWTYYKGLNANEFCLYIDAAGNENLLIANAFGGQVLEMETGFDDQGNLIQAIVDTKQYDFGAAGQLITFARVDVGGLHSEQSSIDLTISVINRLVATKQKTLAYNAAADAVAVSPIANLATKTLASTPLGGGSPAASALTLYPFFRYIATYLTGRNLQLRFESSQKDASFSLNKIAVHPIGQPVDLVPTNLRI